MRNSISFFVVLFLLGMSPLYAHDPLTSRFELHSNFSNGAVMRIYLTQAGVHRTLQKEHPGSDLENKEEYEKMIITYLKDHIDIEADGLPLKLNAGAIKLGSHETSVVFLVKNYPQNVKKLNVNIDAFKENGHHQTVFWWYTPGEKSRFVLSKRNGFQGFFEIGKAPYGKELEQSIASFSSAWIFILAFSINALGVFFFFFRKRIKSALM